MTKKTLATACFEMQDPCEVYQLIEKAYVARMLGEVAVKGKIGDEDTELALPSIAALKTARSEYRALCQSAGGQVVGGRQSLCIEFGDRVCRQCGGRGCHNC